MSKTKNLSKVLALVLMLALMLGIMPMTASATTEGSHTFNYPSSAGYTSAVVSSGDNDDLKILYTKGPDEMRQRYECQIELSPNTTAQCATIDFYNGGNTPEATITVNFPTDMAGQYWSVTGTKVKGNMSYIFTFVMEPGYSNHSDPNCHVFIGLPDEGHSLGNYSVVNGVYTYNNATVSSGFPQSISMRILPGGTGYDDVDDIAVTVDSGTTGVTLTHYAGSYYLVYAPVANAKLNFTVSYTPAPTKTTISESFSITFRPAAQASGGGIYAYLPAPGQYDNEGINAGGWGDAYVANSTGLKSMVDNISSTGVSLGFFGGYVVLDMSKEVTQGNTTTRVQLSNSASNPYGIDFILYGNGFIGNSEPGGVQVAEGKPIIENGVTVGFVPWDVNQDGVIWYDIAGSQYYTSNSVINAKYIYENPEPSDDEVTSPPTSGTPSTDGVDYEFTPADGSVTSGTITYNGFHNHSWFPLYANYFVGRGSNDPLDLSDPLPFAEYHRTEAEVNNETHVTQTKLTLTGVKLKSVSPTNTGDYTFGYADVHGKNTTSGFTAYGTAYNPYSITSANIGSSGAWNNFLGSTYGGGDPIDISWAVYPAKYDTGTNEGQAHPHAGEPVDLEYICFVRVYTAAAAMNGVFGEISTEVCGAYRAVSASGSVGTTNAPSVTITYTRPTFPFDIVTVTPSLPTSSGGTVSCISNIYGASNYEISVTASSGDNVFLNGVKLTESGTGVFTGTFVISSASQKVQILVQSGNAAPYIVVLK